MVRSEVLTSVRMTRFLLWVVTPCRLLRRYRRFGETCLRPLCFLLQVSPEDGDSMFLRNVGVYRRWTDEIRMDVREIGWLGVEWIKLAQYWLLPFREPVILHSLHTLEPFMLCKTILLFKENVCRSLLMSSFRNLSSRVQPFTFCINLISTACIQLLSRSFVTQLSNI
jgi:hypothetical protein